MIKTKIVMKAAKKDKNRYSQEIISLYDIGMMASLKTHFVFLIKPCFLTIFTIKSVSSSLESNLKLKYSSLLMISILKYLDELVNLQKICKLN